MIDQSEDSDTPVVAGGPVGTGDYIVAQGECLASIAYENGLRLETIANHPANRELQRARKDPHILLPGDRVTIPPVQVKQMAVGTDQVHKFRLTPMSEIFQMRLLDVTDQPRANVRYRLVIEGKIYSGITDHDGELQHPIPPNARRGRLILGRGKDREEIDLHLGELDPKDTITGAQARLNNLGLDSGPVDGILGPLTRKAITRFQKANRLEPTGELDDVTIQHLESKHGC